MINDRCALFRLFFPFMFFLSFSSRDNLLHNFLDTLHTVQYITYSMYSTIHSTVHTQDSTVHNTVPYRAYLGPWHLGACPAFLTIFP
jgi:hypothetical protein